MSEQVMFYGVDLASATDLAALLRSEGFDADEPWYLDGNGELRNGANRLLTFAVQEAERHVFIAWSDDTSLAEPLFMRPDGVRPPVVSVEYREGDANSLLLRGVLAIIAAHSEIADTLNKVAMSGPQFLQKLRDPEFDWSFVPPTAEI